jgi:hypothetical protein
MLCNKMAIRAVNVVVVVADVFSIRKPAFGGQ